MGKRQKFSINKETLVREENDNVILTRVPNSEGQYFVAFSRNDVVSQNDKTYILELDEEQQIAMWNEEPHIKFAENAQTNPEYNNSAMTRLSASELYSDYYTYSESSDPSAKQRRQERQQKFSGKKGKNTVQNTEQAAAKGKGRADAVPTEKEQKQDRNTAQEQSAPEAAKKDVIRYDAKQMAEIMKGLIQGVDVDQYRNVDMDAEKMKELRLGLRSGINISPWNHTDITAKAMRELRLGAREVLKIEDIEISKYDGDQLREIRLGLQQGLNSKVKEYLHADYEAAQMRELRLGLKAGLNISAYQDIHFTADQMQQIRYRLVLQNIMQILKNFLEEAKIWISQRVEYLADMLSVKIPVPQFQAIIEEMSAEQSPVAQIKDILIKSELVNAEQLQNKAIDELLKKNITDMVEAISEGTISEGILLEETANSVANVAGANMPNVIYLNHDMFSKTQEISDPQLDKDAIMQMTEEYVEEQIQVMEEAAVMEA